MYKTKNSSINTLAVIIFSCMVFALGYYFGTRRTLSSLSPYFLEKNQVYAIANGLTISSDDVWPKIKEDLRQLEKNKYLIKKRAVEDYLLEKERAAKLAGASETNPSEAPAYSKEELTKFVKERNIDIGKLTVKAREDLINNFILHKKMLAQKAQTPALLKAQNIEWLIPMTYLAPPIEVEQGYLANLGTPNSEHNVIVFANYHCPYCQEANNKIKILQEKYKNSISISFRFSMQEPETSLVFLSALAASCANDQKKFAAFHQALFTKPPTEVRELTALAEATGLNLSQFTPCLETMKHKKDILSDTNQADKLGINRQAVAFVNGHLLQIQEPLETYEAILNQKN